MRLPTSNGRDVFALMIGRSENTEGDLLDKNLDQLLYDGTGYAYDPGGFTRDIAVLTNEEVRCPRSILLRRFVYSHQIRRSESITRSTIERT